MVIPDELPTASAMVEAKKTNNQRHAQRNPNQNNFEYSFSKKLPITCSKHTSINDVGSKVGALLVSRVRW